MNLAWPVSIIFLFVNGLFDIEKQNIPLIAVIIYSVTGILYSIFLRQTDLFEILSSFIPGLFVLSASLLTKGSIGLGDALIILSLGFYINALNIICGLLISLFSSSIYAGFLFIKNRKKDTAFPFVPFLFAGFLLSAVINSL